MMYKNLLLALMAILIPVCLHEQSLAKVLDLEIKNINVNYKQQKNYTNVNDLNCYDRKVVDSAFYPFDVAFVDNSWENKDDDSIKVNKVGFSIDSNNLINRINISVKYQKNLVAWLNHKYGMYANNMSFGVRDEINERTVYNWVTDKFQITLWINRYSMDTTISDNEIITVITAPPNPPN